MLIILFLFTFLFFIFKILKLFIFFLDFFWGGGITILLNKVPLLKNAVFNVKDFIYLNNYLHYIQHTTITLIIFNIKITFREN